MKGRHVHLPFSLNQLDGRTIIAVQQAIAAYASLGVSSLNSGRLSGRLFFAQKRQFANCLISELSNVRFLCLRSENQQS
jgi:hypothetical protein